MHHAPIPASWYIQAQRFRTWYRDRLREVFDKVDIIAPTVSFGRHSALILRVAAVL
ncbi:MAG: hypothetical protein GDA56_04985 [Hormoscilla sp. GM7CHS1pb]|nr:hypothetical protein [Hormoscilla sp. GM7CHS1pb]